jgi:hypothetical protein
MDSSYRLSARRDPSPVGMTKGRGGMIAGRLLMQFIVFCFLAIRPYKVLDSQVVETF